MNLSRVIEKINNLAQQLKTPVVLMEVCGTHTVSAFRAGIPSLLPKQVELHAGPGCPVCVSAADYINKALALAELDDVIITSFGDMLRVPGTHGSLQTARARGSQVKIVYSPMQAIELAEQNPQKQIVFLGVGFETTVPTVAWSIKTAAQKKITNFSVLSAHKTMPQAMAILAQNPKRQIHGFLCPGHVSVITGSKMYEFLAEQYNMPCVIAGFEPVDILRGIELLLEQIIDQRAEVINEYERSVNANGNPKALAVIDEIFKIADSEWRGLGVIPNSGLKIRAVWQAWDAEDKFAKILKGQKPRLEPKGCICGQVLSGEKTPKACSLFGKSCTPEHPIGACMVSSEGTCAAYYQYANMKAL